jgi:hypothetical protein
VERVALKVALALDAAIVLARVILQLNAYPGPRRKVGGSDKADGAEPAIAQTDREAHGEIRRAHIGLLVAEGGVYIVR